ncbi:hypothetical protein [Gordonia zhaorongruii]|uniref:hypothetical protein n=1 Tax=Gordonia zhaorongruii TaxID=2597659 RepID=UPI0010518B99|nr:hypothetical protein [Gordonia zhaorongruii]
MGRYMLTEAQRVVLEAAGSYVAEMPPVDKRASTKTARRLEAIRATGLSREAVMPMLAADGGTVDDRIEDHTLLAVHAGDDLVFPAFQFVDGVEVPHWGQVCPVVPHGDHRAISAESFMMHPACDLVIDDAEVSPVAWLLAGGDPGIVVRLARHAFHQYPAT